MASSILKIKPTLLLRKQNVHSVLRNSINTTTLNKFISTKSPLKTQTQYRLPLSHFRSFSTPATSSSSSSHNQESTQKPKSKIGLGRAALLFVLGTGGAIALYLYIDDYDAGAPPIAPGQRRPRVVVLGSGWATLPFVDSIDTKHYDVIVVSPRNYFLFTPLLPSVTVGTVDPRSITEPVRYFSDRTDSQITYYEASCIDVDPSNNKVTCKVKHRADENIPETFDLEYDHLVVGVGSVNNTFGTPGVYENCNFLKEIEDAVSIRKKIIDSFEAASLPGVSEEEINKLLTFVIVGGGPNGVEFAGELRDFVHENLSQTFPALVPKVKITLLELLDHILNMYDRKIITESHFKKTDIDVKTRSQVLAIEKDFVKIKRLEDNVQVEIPYGLCVWSTGIGPSPLIDVIRNKLGNSQTNRRALLTDGTMRVKGTENIWAIGDCSTIEQNRLLGKVLELFQEADLDKSGNLDVNEFKSLIEKQSSKYPQILDYGKKVTALFEEADVDKDGKLNFEEFKSIVAKVDSKVKMLPATAQVASQQGKYLGKNFNAIARREVLKPFRYRHFGSYAYIGDLTAVAELPNSWVLNGFGAWWLWRSIYWSKQVSWRNRVYVAADWTKAFIFGRDITRN